MTNLARRSAVLLVLGSLASGADAYELFARPSSACTGGIAIAAGTVLADTVYLDVEPQGTEAQGSQAQFYVAGDRISNANCGETDFDGGQPFVTTRYADGQYTVEVWVWNAAQDATLWRVDIPITIRNAAASLPPGTLQLNWSTPTHNDDGSVLTDLLGYSGECRHADGTLVTMNEGKVNTKTFTALQAGGYICTLQAVAAANADCPAPCKSAPTNPVSGTVTALPPPPPPPPDTRQALCMVDGSLTGTRSIFAKKLKADGTPTRGASLGTIAVGATVNEWAAPFDRIECSCTDSWLYGSTRYALVLGRSDSAYVAGCRAYGRH